MDDQKAAHTPGPWVVGDDDANEQPYIHGGDGSLVAKACHEGVKPRHELDANAHLIAAAPDLYGCLRGLLAIPGVREVAQQSIFGSIVYNADAAIAKAEGRS